MVFIWVVTLRQATALKIRVCKSEWHVSIGSLWKRFWFWLLESHKLVWLFLWILSVWLLSPPWLQCFFNLTHGLNQRSTRVFKFLRNLAVGANSHSVGVEIFLILSHVFVFYVCIYFCSQQHKTKLFSFKTYFPKMMRPPNFCKDMFSIFHFYCLKNIFCFPKTHVFH